MEYGTIAPRGNPGIELFYKGKRMDLARYPNQGWLNIADVPQSGDSLYNKGLEREKRFDGVPVGRHYGRITYPGDRPNTGHRPMTSSSTDTGRGIGAIPTRRSRRSTARVTN